MSDNLLQDEVLADDVDRAKPFLLTRPSALSANDETLFLKLDSRRILLYPAQAGAAAVDD